MATALGYIPKGDEDIEDDDDDSEGWSEMDVESDSSLTCLFCPKPFKTMAIALEHCKSEHGFDLNAIKKKFSMDCYSYISLINFVRREGMQPDQVLSLTSPIWMNEKYMVPVLQEDPWLMFDFEGLESPQESRTGSPLSHRVIRNEDGLVTLSEDAYAQILETIKHLSTQVAEKDSALSLAADQIQTMRTLTQDLLNCDDTVEVDRSIARLRIGEDHEYFSSYSHFGIHHTMLSDKPRTVSYRDAILKNANVIQGKVVLDIGCGTGILSMFCSQAGALRIIGVDQSEIIYQAMDIIRENGLENKIELLKGRIEEVALPVEKVDLIVSEWMGYFLFFEGMLDAVIQARNKYLRTGGTLLPNRCSIMVVGISDEGNYRENVEFWSDVYGYKMTTLKKEVLKEAFITLVPENVIVTAPAVVLDLNLNSCTVESSEFTSMFELSCTTTSNLTGICGYFDTAFELPTPVILSTSPLKEKTHWKQTVFYLSAPIPVEAGSTIKGEITCKRKPDDARALVIDIVVQEQKNTYYLA